MFSYLQGNPSPQVHGRGNRVHWTHAHIAPFFFPKLTILPPVLSNLSSAQFSSVTQSCPTLCNPMDYSTPGFPVHHQLLELAQTRVHWVYDATKPFHPLPTPSSPACNLFQHQGLFQWVSSSHKIAILLEFQIQHQSFQWIFRTDFL